MPRQICRAALGGARSTAFKRCIHEDAPIFEADDARRPIAENCHLPIWVNLRGTADGARPDACQGCFLRSVCEEDLALWQIVATLLLPKQARENQSLPAHPALHCPHVGGQPAPPVLKQQRRQRPGVCSGLRLGEPAHGSIAPAQHSDTARYLAMECAGWHRLLQVHTGCTLLLLQGKTSRRRDYPCAEFAEQAVFHPHFEGRALKQGDRRGTQPPWSLLRAPRARKCTIGERAELVKSRCSARI
eukprot:scaffold33888_cov77-Phaeocystis_antarctica.AAC.3